MKHSGRREVLGYGQPCCACCACESRCSSSGHSRCCEDRLCISCCDGGDVASLAGVSGGHCCRRQPSMRAIFSFLSLIFLLLLPAAYKGSTIDERRVCRSSYTTSPEQERRLQTACAGRTKVEVHMRTLRCCVVLFLPCACLAGRPSLLEFSLLHLVTANPPISRQQERRICRLPDPGTPGRAREEFGLALLAVDFTAAREQTPNAWWWGKPTQRSNLGSSVEK